MWINAQLKKLLSIVLTVWCLGQGTVAFGFMEMSVRTTYWSWDGPGGAYGVSEDCHLTGTAAPYWVTHLSAGPVAFELPVQATIVLAVLLGVLCAVVIAVIFFCFRLFTKRYRTPRHLRRQVAPSH